MACRVIGPCKFTTYKYYFPLTSLIKSYFFGPGSGKGDVKVKIYYFWTMKHFGKITVVIISVLIVLFVLNIWYIFSLYTTVKGQTENVVTQCLERADIQEMLIRVSKVNQTTLDTIQIRIPLIYKKTATGRKVPNYDWLGREMFVDSTGYFNVHRQFFRVLARNMHGDLDHTDFPPDMNLLDSLFRVELNAEGLHPREAFVERPGSVRACGHSGLWKLPLTFCDDGKVFYNAYVSALDGHVIGEMAGILGTSLAIIAVVAVALTYLLRTLSKMKTIEEMKDDFIGNMTHELKTPIAIAYAANDSLLNFNRSLTRERLEKYLNVSVDQLAKLTNLVEIILSMSKERQRKIPIEPSRIGARDFIEEIAASHRIRAAKKCAVSVEIDPEAVIKVDQLHFGNVVSNLIDNAMKYSGESVEITITGNDSEIRVADNGIGIAKKNLPYVFDRFYRADSNGVKGLGIGLYYAKTILRRMNWDIRVESQVGKGSVFIMTHTEK